MAKKKSYKNLIIIGAIVLLIIIFIGSFIGTRNSMMEKQRTYQKTWAEVENQYKRRNDLIPNYVSTVKGYAKHEKEIFTQIAESRAKLGGGGAIPDKLKADSMMSSALSRLMVVVERYPDLKANVNFQRLQDELAGTENRIAVERRRYIKDIDIYNRYIDRIPNNFIANIFGYKEEALFKATEAEKVVPTVDFNE